MNHHSVELGGSFFRGHLVPSLIGLTATEWHLLMVVTSFDYSQKRGADVRSGYSYPGNDLIAREMSVSESTVKRSLHSLEAGLFVLRTQQRRGQGKRDFRFIHINYARLERGHHFVLASRARRNASRILELEKSYIDGLMLDDIGFLQRLLEDGDVSWADLLEKAKKLGASRHRRVMSELSIQLGRSSVHSPTTPSDSTLCQIARATPSMGQLDEEDEVRTLRRCVSIRRADSTSAGVSLSQQESHTPTANLSRQSPSDVWALVAAALRRALEDDGLPFRLIEEAIPIVLRYCRELAIDDPEEASDLVRGASDCMLWDKWDASEEALAEFAHELSYLTGHFCGSRR